MKKKIISLTLAMLMTLAALPMTALAADSLSITDTNACSRSMFSVPIGVTPLTPLESASDWAWDDITAAISKGFVPSEIQGNYKNVITRLEFCKMAVSWVVYATGKSIDTVLSEKGLARNPNAFSDTSDPDILAAFALGITNGTGNNQFSPNGQFSREQAATMIMNTCRAIGWNVGNPPTSDFVDLNTAANWAVDGINFVRANGIMQGMGNNSFSPKTAYTREQSIVTFNNIDTDLLNQDYQGSAPIEEQELKQRFEDNYIGYWIVGNDRGVELTISDVHFYAGTVDFGLFFYRITQFDGYADIDDLSSNVASFTSFYDESHGISGTLTFNESTITVTITESKFEDVTPGVMIFDSRQSQSWHD